jgi:hypothetical protein
VLELSVKDSTITGAMIRGDERITLSDGQISKNTLTFKAELNDQLNGFRG